MRIGIGAVTVGFVHVQYVLVLASESNANILQLITTRDRMKIDFWGEKTKCQLKWHRGNIFKCDQNLPQCSLGHRPRED